MLILLTLKPTYKHATTHNNYYAGISNFFILDGGPILTYKNKAFCTIKPTINSPSCFDNLNFPSMYAPCWVHIP